MGYAWIWGMMMMMMMMKMKKASGEETREKLGTFFAFGIEGSKKGFVGLALVFREQVMRL